jgi:hypothetical protein
VSLVHTNQSPTEQIKCMINRDTTSFSCVSADLWALSLTLFIILTGHRPWNLATDGDEVFMSFMAHPNRRVLDTTVPLSPDFHALFKQCMMYEPELRLSLRDMSEALEDIDLFPTDDEIMPSARDGAGNLYAIAAKWSGFRRELGILREENLHLRKDALFAAMARGAAALDPSPSGTHNGRDAGDSIVSFVALPPKAYDDHLQDGRFVIGSCASSAADSEDIRDILDVYAAGELDSQIDNSPLSFSRWSSSSSLSSDLSDSSMERSHPDPTIFGLDLNTVTRSPSTVQTKTVFVDTSMHNSSDSAKGMNGVEDKVQARERKGSKRWSKTNPLSSLSTPVKAWFSRFKTAVDA